jgi:hypothetical protein
MAAATQVPAGTWHGKGWIVQLTADINTAVAEGIFAGSDTVTTALANLATEQATR